jgi:hypothetical protein
VQRFKKEKSNSEGNQCDFVANYENALLNHKPFYHPGLDQVYLILEERLLDTKRS